MDYQLPVEVTDEKGAAIAGARVCLVTKATLGAERFPYVSLAATHNDKGGGHYEPKTTITPTAGEWVLLVSLKGKSPVLQPFKFAERKGELSASPTPRSVATVVMKSTVRTVGKSKVKEIHFAVKLYRASEIAFLAGVDYNRRDISGGWQFHEYGFNRAEVLRRKKKINPGTIVTVFSTSKIRVTTRVWGVKRWVDVAVAQLGDPKSRVLPLPSALYRPRSPPDIHVTDFYKYLAEVGKREPHSVKEVGIFSHSWPGGPILYDTYERDAYGSRPERDPMDFDARAKDFNDSNFAAYREMKDALATDCRFSAWGCSATTHYKQRSRKALAAIKDGLKEDEFFIVHTDVESHGILHSKIEERTSELRHRYEMDLKFRGGTYIAEAAWELDVESRSACPGCGSDPTTIDGIEMVGVNVETHKEIFQYFHLKFSPEFKETNEKWDTGYIDYHALQRRTPVAEPTFSTKYYYLEISMKKDRKPKDPPPAYIEFWNEKGLDHPTPNVSVESRAVSGMKDPMQKGHLYVLRDRDETKSQAVYVQGDGKVFKVTKDAKNAFSVVGPEL